MASRLPEYEMARIERDSEYGLSLREIGRFQPVELVISLDGPRSSIKIFRIRVDQAFFMTKNLRRLNHHIRNVKSFFTLDQHAKILHPRYVPCAYPLRDFQFELLWPDECDKRASLLEHAGELFAYLTYLDR